MVRYYEVVFSKQCIDTASEKKREQWKGKHNQNDFHILHHVVVLRLSYCNSQGSNRRPVRRYEATNKQQ